jgi:hypothetical protein
MLVVGNNQGALANPGVDAVQSGATKNSLLNCNDAQKQTAKDWCGMTRDVWL